MSRVRSTAARLGRKWNNTILRHLPAHGWCAVGGRVTILNDITNIDRSKLILIDDILRTKNNSIKLKCRQVNSDCTKFFFTNVVVRDLTKLPPSVIQCNTVDSFKNKLDRHFLELNINKSRNAMFWSHLIKVESLRFKDRPPSLDNGICVA